MPDEIVPESRQPISRERFLSVLNDITFAALETRDLDELLQLLADRLADIIGADGCYITLWDNETDQVRPGAAYGPLREIYKEVVVEPGELTITHAVLKAGKSIVVPDLQNTNYTTNRITSMFPARSMLGIPIFQGETRLGAALFAFNEIHEFLDQEIDYCEQAVRQISLAIANVKNLVALKKSEENHRLAAEALQQREAHLLKAQANARMGSWENDIKLGNAVWSDELYRLFDLPPQSGVPEDGDLIELVAKQDRRHFSSTLFSAVETGELAPLEFETIHGRRLAGEIYLDSTKNKIMGMLQDVTQQRELENELFQARKMEAVGTLAGGIAHNFNNILTVIMGNYEILKASTSEGSPERKVLDHCLNATDRAAKLTRQLLVVSRKHELRPSNINLNLLVTDILALLQPLIGEHISIDTTLSSKPGMVHADPGHLEQVIMNLTLNARDALESGGRLSIKTGSIKRDGVLWSAVTVKDYGVGIAPASLPHIFEPFYTTKEEGKGTGLGLATVASIVEQSHGKIEVQSTPGEGTSITILLPTLDQKKAQKQGKKQGKKEERQSSRSNRQAEEIKSPQAENKKSVVQTILLVEDHESLRNIACFALEKAGYQVLAAADTEEARQIFYGSLAPELLLTDIQLPGGTGIQLAEEFRATRRDLPVIFMSGLPDNQKNTGDSTFLAKPFRPFELIAAVKTVLL